MNHIITGGYPRVTNIQFFRNLVVFTIVCGFLTSCASSSTFSSYTQQAEKYRDSLESRNEAKALAILDKKRNSADQQLYMIERGRIAALAGQSDESIKDFKQAIDAIAQEEGKAKISVSHSSAKVASFLSNDNAIPYSVDGYEKVFIHHMQALNYIAKQDLDAAAVEIRRANFAQNETLEKHSKELAKARETAEQKQLQSPSADFYDNFTVLDEAAGRVKNSFQSAYTFYTSGLVYEAIGAANDAYIDYKKAQQIYPNNRYVQRDLIRLAKQLGFSDDYRRFSKQFDLQYKAPAKNTGTLVVFYETGYIPKKQQIILPVPTVHGWLTIAIPTYMQAWQDFAPLTVKGEGHYIGTTETITDMYALAAKALKEELPATLTHLTVRAISKYLLQKEADSRGGPLAGLATQIYNIVSERADLRSWLTLPAEVQIMRTDRLPTGKHSITLKSGSQQRQLEVDIKSDKNTIIRVVRGDTRMITQVLTF